MKLQDIIDDEYGTEVAFNNAYSDRVSKLAKPMGEDDAEKFVTALMKDEKYTFEQGFVRGLAAAKRIWGEMR